MSYPKKHHYIPACYLKGFTNQGKRTSLFWAFPKNKPGFKHGTNPNDACVSNNYYKLEENIRPFLIEEWYGNTVETRIGEFLETIDSSKGINSEDEGLIWLLSSLFLRNPQHRNNIEAPLRQERKIVESMKKDLNQRKVTLDMSVRDYIIDDIIEYELKQTKIASYYLPQFNYSLIKAPNKINTITSDSPFILSHNRLQTFGLATPGSMILTPLNKNTFLFGCKEMKLSPIHNATDKTIADLNTMIMLSSNEKCFSNNDHFFILDAQDNIAMYP
ncbi:DUF4238 domain-containing protein [Enterobacter cancerogenus]|uniref:DUF4238 domain-containing protein n=1 Tax=Enterobacter cancerogenus TaxID=69218 RepID=UPI0038061916